MRGEKREREGDQEENTEVGNTNTVHFRRRFFNVQRSHRGMHLENYHESPVKCCNDHIGLLVCSF